MSSLGRVLDLLATCITAAISLVLLVRLRTRWRDEHLWSLSAPGFWPYSEALWDSIMRTAPLVPAWMLPGLVMVELDESSPAHFVLGLWIVAVWAVAANVILYNRPKWVVPPALRDEPGLRERK